MNRNWNSSHTFFVLLPLLVAGWISMTPGLAQTAGDEPNFLSFARFKIPFNVEAHATDLSEVQLWVSTDEGETWQMHGSAAPSSKQFDFKAAAEGLYLFAVQTVDQAGNAFPSQTPPLRVYVDTSKPEAAMRADVNANGQLAIDIRMADDNLLPDSGILRIRTDRDSDWRDVPLEPVTEQNGVFETHAFLDLEPCREVALVFVVNDRAKNEGEATFKYAMPRTALGDRDMTLASTGSGQNRGASRVPNLGSTQLWEPEAGMSSAPRISGPSNQAQVIELSRPGKLAGTGSGGLELEPSGNESATTEQRTERPLPNVPQQSLPPAGAPQGVFSHAPYGQAPTQGYSQLASPRREDAGAGNPGSQSMLTAEPLPSSVQPAEELPMPIALDDSAVSSNPPASRNDPRQLDFESETADRSSSNDGLFGRAFHCKSRAFSLDYSVDALGGASLSDVELWGTEDGGRTWQQWGSDPDRTSPFDVQVGNDGLFGFRMVIIAANGLVSNRPKDGDSADVWINVDTSIPTAKITRAVYGEGPEDGMLVIDYKCADGHLVDRPISLSYSERADGPWTDIAAGLKNTGIYLWKADPNLPEQIYIRLQCVDKSGNTGVHRLDVPIDTKGLGPRGRIQGFRPIMKSDS